MKSMRCLATLSAIFCLVPAAGGWASDDERVEADELRARVAALEARLATLQSDSIAPLSERRADEIRALVRDVLADADTRASLLQDGGTAGWDNGFFLASADGNFRLNVSGQLQFRYMIGFTDDVSIDGTRGGFENSRTKLVFSGHVVDPTWIYRIEGEFSRSGGGSTLLDGYVGKALGDGWTVIAGQFKVPTFREWLVYSDKQLAVERSLVAQEFSAGRTQGVAIDYRNDWFHFTGGFTDGHPASGGFNMPALTLDTEYSFTGRAEVLLDGEWSRFADFTSWPDEEPAILLGGAMHYQVGEYGTPAPEIEVLQWMLDGSVELGGANVSGLFLGRHIEVDGGALQLDQYGAVVQGGFFLTDDWEVFGRFEWGDDDLSGEDLSILTVGANHYFASHQAKWTSDVGYAFNAVSSTWGDGFLGTGGGIAGWRTDPDGDDGQVVLRSQIQILF